MKPDIADRAKTLTKEALLKYIEGQQKKVQNYIVMQSIFYTFSIVFYAASIFSLSHIMMNVGLAALLVWSLGLIASYLDKLHLRQLKFQVVLELKNAKNTKSTKTM